MSWRERKQLLFPSEVTQENIFFSEHMSLRCIWLQLVHCPFQLHWSSRWDQLLHFRQTGWFTFNFRTISCFSGSAADLNAGQSLTRLEIASFPSLSLYLWASLLQTGQVLEGFAVLCTAAEVFGRLQVPWWNLLQEEHFVFWASGPRAELIDSCVRAFLAMEAECSRKV